MSCSTKTIGLAMVAIALTGNLGAQESPSPSPTETASPPARNIRVSFVPPPLDGTISLGIYDAKGNLVRVLFREADINEFTIGNDSLSTTWDGKDDAGENAPAGKYTAHGWVVGDLKIEGVGFFFNDWITAPDAPRFSKIRSISVDDANLLLSVDLVPPGSGHVIYDVADKTTKLKDTDNEDIAPSPSAKNSLDIDPIASVPGRDGSRWVIDHVAKDSPELEVKEYASSGELLRRLPPSASGPQPKCLAAAKNADTIYLLEESETGQRVRALTLAATKTEGATQAVSEWKVELEKSITAHKDFSVVDGKPVAKASQAAPEKVKIKLLANPLLNDDRVTVELAMGYDADGSFLKSADGLPLCSISETQSLIRALVTSRGSNTLYVFQDDGAVVEQFRVTGADQMMSFDCGGFELK
ncbi:MAG: hypothetical protein ACJ8M4_11720 [Chthoniobacterales bacterium]